MFNLNSCIIKQTGAVLLTFKQSALYAIVSVTYLGDGNVPVRLFGIRTCGRGFN